MNTKCMKQGNIADMTKCVINGNIRHKVKDITDIPLEERIGTQAKYKYQGKCEVCNNKIVAKDKAEYRKYDNE